MNILLFGPQGSGKGTQARLLMEKYNFSYFESGAYLRRIAEEHPDIKKTMDEGKLVPDEEFTSYLTAYLDSKNMYDQIIFDGFPRTVEQYNFLKNWLKEKQVSIDLVLVLEISEEESIKRLSARRLDPETGNIYNLVTEPPPDDVDASRLVHREDDQPEAIKRRLGIYRSRTQLLVDELAKEVKIVEVDGERPPEVISAEISAIIDQMNHDQN